MKKDKEEKIYYCFRYKCKRCPKQKECEKELKKENAK
jgi:hypothetical protein